MKSRVISTLAVAAAMALPVAGAAASDTAEVEAEAGASAAGVEVTAAAHAGVTLPAPPAGPPSGPPGDAPSTPPLDVPPADIPPADVPPADPPPADPPPADVPPADTPPADVPPVELPPDRETSDESPREPKTETFQVRDAGEVTLTYSRRGIHDVQAHPNEGWRHRVERRDERTVQVGFTDGETAYVFTAHVTKDGELRTRIDERGTRQGTRTETFEVCEAGDVTLTWNAKGIHDVQVDANEGWRHRVERRDERTVQVGFTDGETAYMFTAHVTEDGRLRTHTQRHDRDQPHTMSSGDRSSTGSGDGSSTFDRR